jgi:aarF domain-containing kinase
MNDEAVKTGLWSRSSRILGMAAKVAGHEVRHGVRKRLASSADKLAGAELRTRIAQAKIITENLSELKGAVMKAGQLLSIDASDILPEEATEILSKLQGKADPVDFSLLYEVLLDDLGHERLGRLEGLNPEAAASASIGQVHRASIRGQPVAVKIQYPGIAKSIDSDMKMMGKLADSWLTLTRSRIDIEETLEEMRLILHLEADYVRERVHLEEYRERLGDDRRFVVPKTYAELCGERVLTMSWEDGHALKDWIAAGPSREQRVAFARAVLDLFCKEFFEWGFVQTDPNHGNFLVRDDGRIVLLDFGATLRYDETFRRDYVELLKIIASKDVNATVQAGIEFGIFDPREPELPRRLFAEMLFSSMQPFEAQMQPFEFRDDAYAARSREIATRFTRSLEFSPPPRKLLFLHRKLGGIFQLLRRLNVTLDLQPYWAKMVEDPCARADVQPLLRGRRLAHARSAAAAATTGA